MKHNKKSSIASVFVMLFVILIIYLSYLALREKTNSPIYGLKEKELSQRAEVELSIVRAQLAFALKNSILNAMYKVGNSCCSEKEYTVVGNNVLLSGYEEISQKIIKISQEDFKNFLNNYPKERGIFSIYISPLEEIGLHVDKNKIQGGGYDNGFDAYVRFSEPINLTYNKLIISSPKEINTKVNSKFFYVLRKINYVLTNVMDFNILRNSISIAPRVGEGCQRHNFEEIGRYIRDEFTQKLNVNIGEGVECTDYYIINGTSKPRDKINVVVADECENPEGVPVPPAPICKNLHKQYNADSWNAQIVQKFAQATTARECLQYDYNLYLEIITICKLRESEQYTDLGIEPLTIRFRTLFPIDVQCVAELSCP